jgi:hypothetical protein
MTDQFAEQQVETPDEEETAPKDTTGALFGPPPLIDGETEEAYEAFKVQVRAALGPIDAIDEILIRQFVNDEWEVQRLRRLKGGYLQFIIRDGLKPVLSPFYETGPLQSLIDDWARRDPEALKEVDSLLKQSGLAMAHVTAVALLHKIKDFEGMDRLISVAESRRNQALRELERHHESLAHRVQSAAKRIEEGEFRVVEPALEDSTCD